MASPGRRAQDGPGLAHSMRRAGRWLVISAVLFVALLVAGGIASGGGHDVLHLLGRLGPASVGALLGLSLLNYAARALRWHLFSRRVGVELSLGRDALYFVAGFALTVTPGKLGEALRLWLLRRGHGYRYERTASLLVADRLSDFAGIAFLCVVGAASFADRLAGAVAALLLVAAATVVLLNLRLTLRLVNAAYARVGRWPRLFARLRTMLRALARLASWRVYGLGLVLAVLGWLAEATALHLLLRVLGAHATLMQAVFVFTFSMLVGAVAMLPGGLGGTEVSMAALLVALGVQLDIAIAATAVIRATTLWFAVGLGFLALPLALRAAGQPPLIGARAA